MSIDPIMIRICTVLGRTDLKWSDDMKSMTRKVWSKNKDKPLTEEEKQIVQQMYDIAMIPYKIEFLEAEVK